MNNHQKLNGVCEACAGDGLLQCPRFLPGFVKAMKQALREPIGTTEAIAEIHRQAEARLVAVMKPARLSPFNYSHRNGMAASDAVIEEIRDARHNAHR